MEVDTVILDLCDSSSETEDQSSETCPAAVTIDLTDAPSYGGNKPSKEISPTATIDLTDTASCFSAQTGCNTTTETQQRREAEQKRPSPRSSSIEYNSETRHNLSRRKKSRLNPILREQNNGGRSLIDQITDHRTFRNELIAPSSTVLVDGVADVYRSSPNRAVVAAAASRTPLPPVSPPVPLPVPPPAAAPQPTVPPSPRPNFTKPYDISQHPHHADDLIGRVIPTNTLPYYWRIVLLVDGNERRHVKDPSKDQSQILNSIRRTGLHVETGLSTVKSTSNSDGTRKNLPVGDYAMVARKIDAITHSTYHHPNNPADNKDTILNFIVERKHVLDLIGSITTTPTGPFRPLSRMESQMRRLRYGGVASNPIVLIEGDERRYGPRNQMTEERRKAVGTFRDMLREGEYFPDFCCVETKDISGTILWLAGEMRRMTGLFRRRVGGGGGGGGLVGGDGVVAEVGTFDKLMQRVEETMKDQTFGYYLGLVNLAGVGEKRAMAVMEQYVTVAGLAQICAQNDDDCLEELAGLKTKVGKGGRKLGMKAAVEIRNWCTRNWLRIDALPHARHALPFRSPSIQKTRSSAVIDPLP